MMPDPLCFGDCGVSTGVLLCWGLLVGIVVVGLRMKWHDDGRSGAVARVPAHRFDNAAPDSPFGATHLRGVALPLRHRCRLATAPTLAGARPDDIWHPR
ncbi:hypothetical protein [Streptomyces capitiformicae]|uniref:hypothetical protein n=1 Tax=Streptomyces capitiformicae TaxID=2014920 RepID=UPI001AD8138F|nr:hypothetical protein [Streptomyces capitiformicae]